jgi:hypothetical protein
LRAPSWRSASTTTRGGWSVKATHSSACAIWSQNVHMSKPAGTAVSGIRLVTSKWNCLVNMSLSRESRAADWRMTASAPGSSAGGRGAGASCPMSLVMPDSLPASPAMGGCLA